MQKSEKKVYSESTDHSSPKSNCVAINLFSKMMIEQSPQKAFNLLKEVTVDTWWKRSPVGEAESKERDV